METIFLWSREDTICQTKTEIHLRKTLQNCLQKKVEMIYKDDEGAKIIKGIVCELTHIYCEDNDYVHIDTETLPGKYDTTEGQSIYLHKIKVVTHGNDTSSPISISEVWSNQNEKVRVTLKDETYYDRICLEPRRLEFEEDDFGYVVPLITTTKDYKSFHVQETDIEDIKSISNITPYMEAREQLTKLTGK